MAIVNTLCIFATPPWICCFLCNYNRTSNYLKIGDYCDVMAIEVVLKDMGELLEGPHWDDVTNTLIYVDITKKLIHSYNPVTKEAKKVVVHSEIGAAVPTSSGRTLASVGREVGYVDWETGKFETFCEVDIKKSARFNDCKCDPSGRFWVGSMDKKSFAGCAEEYKGQGSLYCVHPDKTVRECVQNVDISNGMAWAYGVDAFDYNNETGEIANRRQVIGFPKGGSFPDGMCIDDEGMLWIAMFGGWSVHRFNPRTGEKLYTIKFPTKNITSCCWGGANRDELYVACAKVYLTEEELKEQETAGSVFRVTGLGVKGVKCDVFSEN
ncbi:regucalcin-like isoform X2 [Lytechinus variegatus]|uniref:regucalcin-like isoform X2 n=1 Tax=Lytechinus variegatus TaxID=7654 RepID=UPI001BB28681|nr:regucalcin-like isoform X2 [Lytechinus variegatus]